MPTKSISLTKDIKDTKYTQSTTIRISEETKNKIENLDFVRKHTFDEILNELIMFYNKNNKKNKGER